MEFAIDVAAAADFLNIAALDRLAWPDMSDTFIPDGEHIWRVWSDHAVLLVARVKSRGPLTASEDIAGALVMFPTKSNELFLHKVMVHPICRGQGIGIALMKSALAGTSAAVLLTVDPQNSPAVGLYKQMGFTIRERINGYYRPHEDRLIMEFVPK